jgi:hypothetical protein
MGFYEVLVDCSETTTPYNKSLLLKKCHSYDTPYPHNEATTAHLALTDASLFLNQLIAPIRMSSVLV